MTVEEIVEEIVEEVRRRSPDRPWEGPYPGEPGARQWHIIESVELDRLLEEINRLREGAVT